MKNKVHQSCSTFNTFHLSRSDWRRNHKNNEKINQMKGGVKKTFMSDFWEVQNEIANCAVSPTKRKKNEHHRSKKKLQKLTNLHLGPLVGIKTNVPAQGFLSPVHSSASLLFLSCPCPLLPTTPRERTSSTFGQGQMAFRTSECWHVG